VTRGSGSVIEGVLLRAPGCPEVGLCRTVRPSALMADLTFYSFNAP
jgi:hypothetical protein